MGEDTFYMSKLPDIAFVTLSMDDLRKSFATIADKPVESFIDVKTPVFRPNSPLSSVLLQLHRTRNFLPVVEERTERLVGLISTWDLLGLLEVDQEAPLPIA